MVQVTRPTLDFYPLPLSFFSKFWCWKRIAEQNNFVLLFSSNFRIWRKNTYHNDHLKRSSKFLCIGSKRVKKDYMGHIFKNIPFISVLSYLIHFKSGLNIPIKNFSKKVASYLPTLFFSGCNLNHTYFLFGQTSKMFNLYHWRKTLASLNLFLLETMCKCTPKEVTAQLPPIFG